MTGIAKPQPVDHWNRRVRIGWCNPNVIAV